MNPTFTWTMPHKSNPLFAGVTYVHKVDSWWNVTLWEATDWCLWHSPRESRVQYTSENVGLTDC